MEMLTSLRSLLLRSGKGGDVNASIFQETNVTLVGMFPDIILHGTDPALCVSQLTLQLKKRALLLPSTCLVASSPCRHEGELELHIGAAEHNAYALEVVEAMQKALAEDGDIAIDAPHGDAWVKEESDRPLYQLYDLFLVSFCAFIGII